MVLCRTPVFSTQFKNVSRKMLFSKEVTKDFSDDQQEKRSLNTIFGDSLKKCVSLPNLVKYINEILLSKNSCFICVLNHLGP